MEHLADGIAIFSRKTFDRRKFRAMMVTRQRNQPPAKRTKPMNITKSGNVTKSGNGYFTDDAEYIVSRDGASIKRGDGDRMIVPAGEDAHEIAEALAHGQRNDSEFEWE